MIGELIDAGKGELLPCQGREGEELGIGSNEELQEQRLISEEQQGVFPENVTKKSNESGSKNLKPLDISWEGREGTLTF